MEDDPYRTLSEWILESKGFIKCGSQGTTKIDPYVVGAKEKNSKGALYLCGLCVHSSFDNRILSGWVPQSK